MATFRVHEDLEKENRLNAPAGGKKATVPLGTLNPVVAQAGKNQALQTGTLLQQQRTMFSVLNNVQPGNVPNAEKAVKEAKGKLQHQRAAGAVLLPKVGDENGIEQKAPGLQAKVAQKSVVTVTSEVLQAFQVYDESKENLTHLNVAKREEVHHHEKRGPLQEIKNVDLLETPMSVSESYSPMSVDKSSGVIVVEDVPIPRNDRERFYEVEDYQQDILMYLKEAERRNRPKPGYMQKQTDITHSMRTILVDWLVEVSEEYKLHGETLALAVSYIDRFLSFMSVVRAKLQLVGTAALFIAAKYEEIYPPDVGEFVYITDDTYTKTQVLRMEQLILKVLSFDLTVPTSLVFTNLYCVMNDLPDKVKFLTMYICELSLLDADPYLTYVQSEIAAGALALARRALDLPMWSKMLENNIGYRLSALKNIILDLSKTHNAAASIQQQAIQEKYKSKTYKEVAFLPAAILTEDTFDKICDLLSTSSTTAALSSNQQGKDIAAEQKNSLVFV